jgi:hypothetical protein
MLGLGLGLLGDLLLRGTPWGINVVVWGAAVGAAAAVAGHRNARASASRLVVLVLGVLCLTTFAWRDAEFLQVWGLVALLAGLSLVTADALGVSLPSMRIREAIAAALESGLRAASQAGVLLARDIPWDRWTGSARWQRAPAVAIGVALAIPVVLVFGGLLRSAEPQFAALTDRLLGWDVPTVASHIALTGSIAWITAGYLHALASGPQWLLRPPEFPGLPRLGLIPLAVPLGALMLMLLVFAAIQTEYLFGGAATVLKTTGLTVAEYARRGFFELIILATLVLGLLLAAHAALDRTSKGAVRGFRILAAPLIVLVGVVMASALVRMRLYVRSFGLTEDRIYAAAFLLWVGVVLAWFAVTVLRERASRFAYGAVVTGFATLLTLGALDPHALIVRINVARAASGHELDAEYLNGLSADAVPALLAAWPALDASARCELWRGVLHRWIEASPADWRSWNLSRQRARRAAASADAPACEVVEPEGG